MHVLATQAATLDETVEAVDLIQTPADVVVLSFSDSDLSVVVAALEAEGSSFTTVRLASLKQLKHPMSVDLYIDRVIGGARAVLVRVLGGIEYWRYGIERIGRLAREKGIYFAAVPGDDRPDLSLAEHSTADADTLHHIELAFRLGGVDNVRQALRALVSGAGIEAPYTPPVPLDVAVLLDRDGRAVPLASWTADQTDAQSGRATALIVFYRANLMASDTAPIRALMEALWQEGLSPRAIAVTSLKDPAVAPAIQRLIDQDPPSIILNATAFSARRDDNTTVLDRADVPVLQVVLAGSLRSAWASSPRGLSGTDLAMNVVLPELDGRIVSRAISFKRECPENAALEYAQIRHEPDLDRVRFVARLAAAWVRLAKLRPDERRVALMLSDYPQRSGRAGYAVGLDTAESALEIVGALRDAGYNTGSANLSKPAVEALLNGHAPVLRVPRADYQRYHDALPPALQSALEETWGPPEADPSFADGAFVFQRLALGKVTVLLQPDRGAAADRKSGYHDGTRPPRHAYVALYAHLRETERIAALVHLGTHGTLEWLPGKALALSNECWPEAVLGPLPMIYPFIVNNPGEAAHAKRRISAVTIGHLTPPLSAAGLHGAMASLEGLIEEYTEADGVDARRIKLIENEIVAMAWSSGLARDCGLVKGEPARVAVSKLDAQLCDIKGLSVRDRLHVFGRAPIRQARHDLAEAIVKAMLHSDGATASSIEAVGDLLGNCGKHERVALLAALDGRRVAPGPSGAPSRGRADVLPTGRNLTTTDPRAIPTRTAAMIGARAADEVVRRYLQDHGEYPRRLVLDLWASPTLRTGGDDLAHALSYLGARPIWDTGSNRVTGVEVLPLARLDRPRIDVTLRISGLFRDLFETQIALFDLAVREVAARREDETENPLAGALSRNESLVRVFGSQAGSYGAGVASLALDTDWTTQTALGEAYLANSQAVLSGGAGEAVADFRARVSAADALVHGQDDAERDILDGDGVADFAGGFAAAAQLLGNAPSLYHLDASNPSAPKARTLEEEVRRIVRGRLTNPRWIEGMLSHGHRGVAEIAQGVDALYAFSAAANVVPGQIFDATHEALVTNQEVFSALVVRNPKAAEAIAKRLLDAMERGLWLTRRNATAEELRAALAEALGQNSSQREAAQ